MTRTPFRLAVCYGVLGLWSLICVLPIYWLGLASIQSAKDLQSGPRYLPFVDFTPTLESWSFILADQSENLLASLWNSCVIGFGATLLTMVCANMVMFGVTRRAGRLPGNGLVLALLASRILPPAVMTVPLYIMAFYAGLLDSRTFLIFVYAAINLPVAVWLLRPVFGNRATDQEEAAQLDGASSWTIFATILLPMIAGSIATVSVLIFILCWNEYLFAAFLATDQSMTLTPWAVGQLSLKEAQVGGEAEEWGHLSAATILMTLPLLALTGVVQRLLSRSLVWQK